MLRSHSMHARRAIRIVALLFVSSSAVGAQTEATRFPDWELRVATGSMMPTGAQRNEVRSGPLTAAQVSWLPKSSLAVTATLGWARTRDLASVGSPKLNAFSADLGVEARPDRWSVGSRVSFHPFVGVGAGSRSYDYRHQRGDATHNLAGYGAVGGELRAWRLALRMEARNYVSGYKSLASARESDVRSDAHVLFALRYIRRAATHP